MFLFVDKQSKMSGYCKPNNQPVILSLSKFFRARSEEKPRRQSAAGISFKILVAFCIDVTSRWQATKTRYEIPQTALHFALLMRSSSRFDINKTHTSYHKQ